MARTRTNIEIENDDVERIKQLYGVRTKTEAVDLALRGLAGLPPLTPEEMRAMHGAHAIGEIPEDRRPVAWD